MVFRPGLSLRNSIRGGTECGITRAAKRGGNRMRVKLKISVLLRNGMASAAS